MTKFLKTLGRVVRDESGATMVEYALMLGLIAVVCTVGATALGIAINGRFTSLSTSF